MANIKKLVFVVEDNPVQQKQLQVHFEKILGDYDVRLFASGDELIKNLGLRPYAIVLDHFFERERKTGLDYLAELRKIDKSLRVIYHTTLDDDEMKKKVMDMGAEMYIVKDSASMVRLRTALDNIQERASKKGFFSKLFGK